jgi:hypothetical protein
MAWIIRSIRAFSGEMRTRRYGYGDRYGHND